MKLLIFTDNHFCETYSIIQKHGTSYTKRLENQLETMAWIKSIAEQCAVDAMVCLGDFFDRSELTDQEITAAREIQWTDIPTYFLVGNHESSESDLQYNSTKALEAANRIIISEPQKAIEGDCEICFLPYVVESDRLAIDQYFGDKQAKHRIIFSHNDIKGIQMGPVISRLGFDIPELEDSCDLFVNGHLHNGMKITEKVINLGDVTGKDFSEDASKYSHNIMILDTETLQYQLIENPVAFNFYKIEIQTKTDFMQLANLKQNAALSIKCLDSLLEDLRTELTKYSDKIIESRIIAIRNSSAEDTTADKTTLTFTVDHLTRFIDCCRANIEASDILEAELAEVCK